MHSSRGSPDAFYFQFLLLGCLPDIIRFGRNPIQIAWGVLRMSEDYFDRCARWPKLYFRLRQRERIPYQARAAKRVERVFMSADFAGGVAAPDIAGGDV